MKSFPTVYDLATASEEQVNSHWAGLGFYRRARLLHKGAKHVVTELDGQLPETPDGLLKIDGIGPYTAAAISSIAYNASVAVVDGNVCRVLSRLTGIANHIKSPIFKDKLGWDLATQLVLAGGGKDAGQVNQALMELGATYCAPSGTGVDPRDPLREFYLSCQLGRAYAYAASDNENETVYKYKAASKKRTTSKCALCNPDGIEHVLQKFQEKLNNEPVDSEAAAKCGHAIFPLDPPKMKKREEDLAVGALCNTWNEETWWLLTKRPKEGLLAGQWEFPSTLMQTRHVKNSKTQQPPKASVRRSALDQLLLELTNEEEWICELKRVPVNPAPLEHIFSHVKHIMWVECASSAMQVDGKEWTASDGKQVRWMREKDEMKQVGITSGVKKVMKAVKEQQQATAPRKRAKR
jgi:A/G-specific adenine glycosylase